MLQGIVLIEPFLRDLSDELGWRFRPRTLSEKETVPTQNAGEVDLAVGVDRTRLDACFSLRKDHAAITTLLDQASIVGNCHSEQPFDRTDRKIAHRLRRTDIRMLGQEAIEIKDVAHGSQA